MSENFTPEEAQKRNIEKMGEDLGTLYSLLWQELARLHQVWEEYIVLFGTNQERFDIMNKSAPHFFNIAQQAFWEKIILGVARITDRPKTFGKSNASMAGLGMLLEDKQLANKFREAMENVEKETGFCRDWRNRIIAHKDLQHQIDGTLKPLLPASRLGIKNALKSLSKALNVVSLHYLDSTTMFDLMGASPGGSFSLLAVLDDGNKVEEEMSNKIKNSNYNPDVVDYLKPRKF